MKLCLPNKSLGGQKAPSFYNAMVCLWINLYSMINVRDHITSQLNSFPSNILSFLKDSSLLGGFHPSNELGL
jgi:hypothetical protein